jgi:CHAT domain-containing protein
MISGLPLGWRLRLRWAFLAAVSAGCLGCAAFDFVVTRSRMADAELPATGPAAVSAACVAVYGIAYIVLLASEYRAHQVLRWTVAGVFATGLAPFTYATTRPLGAGVVPWLPTTAVTVLAAVMARRSIDRAVRLKTLWAASPGTGDDARAMARDATRIRKERRLNLEQRKVTRISEALALIVGSGSVAHPDRLVEATDLLGQVLADPPSDPLMVHHAATELVAAMDLKATKHGDLTGYREALEVLAGASELMPADAGAFVHVHAFTAEYHLTRATRLSGADADAALESSIAELRRAVSAVTGPTRRLLPDLYARLGARVGGRGRYPSDLDEGIELCRQGQRCAGRSRRRVGPDLALADLLERRALEVCRKGGAAVSDPAADPAADLAEAEALCRRVARRGDSAELRRDAFEQLAGILRTREALFPEPALALATAEAWRAATRHARHGEATAAMRVARAWVDWAVDTGDTAGAAEAYYELMSLIPRTSFMRYLREEKERSLLPVQSDVEEAGYWLTRAGRYGDAVVALELGRAVAISEVAGRERPDSEEALTRAGRPELARRYRDAVARMSEAERDVPAAPGGYSSPLHRAWAEYEAVCWEVAAVQGIDGIVPGVRYADLVAATRDGPLVYVAAAANGGYALIVTGRGDPELVDLPRLTAAEVRKRADAAVTHVDQTSLSRTLRFLWERGMARLGERLPAGAVVTLVPVGHLGLLPLHAAGILTGSDGVQRWRHLADRLAIRYTPNARALVRSFDRAASHDGRPLSLAAFDAPRGPGVPPRARLEHTRREVLEVDERWRATRQPVALVSPARRADALRVLSDHAVWHFACHGEALPDQILGSGLVLTDARLTLRDMLAVPVASRRLAVLSGCETHVSGRGLPNEAMGLPGGMLQVGLAGVVASQWKVTDRAAVFLVAKFYDNWSLRGLPPVRALAEAQRWLRGATRAELNSYLPGLYPPPPGASSRSGSAWGAGRPYEHPYYWASFAMTGS